MGISIRIVLLNEDDSLRRLPLTTFGRLLDRDPDVQFREYAGKRVRCAEVAIQLENRQPVAALRSLYFILPFDSEGMVDAAEQIRERRLGADLLAPLILERRSQKVIDAEHRFTKKRFEREFRWIPTPEVERAMMSTALGIS